MRYSAWDGMDDGRSTHPGGRLMNDIAQRAEPSAATQDLWQLVPLECILSAVAVLVAAGLKLAGFLP
ncbi:hypothetical protein FOHLNKBM_3987 [Methylobacterium longum]|nr:hypothetical protein FOHLNKBM_3987 [Methylobacterium longum]